MPGWHACGSIMDYIERCYTSSMRPFPDRPDVTVPGRWYWCVKGAKPVPFPSTFFSLGNADRGQWDGGIGEVLFSNVPCKGKERPEFSGQNVCGSADVWAHGAPYAALGTPAVDERGVPPCCQGVGESGQGGISIGGKGLDTATAKEVGQGGLAVGGYGLEVGFAYERSQGGLSVGGKGLDTAVATEVGQGGLAVGGYGLEVGFAYERSQGGLSVGGYGPDGAITSETGQGGLSIGGYGLEVGFVYEMSQGGLAVGGQGIETAIYKEVGQGGLSVGGQGTGEGSPVPLTAYNCAAVTAVGTTQAAAVQLANDINDVTTTNTDYAVRLPAGCYRIVVRCNPASAHSLNVFPPVGAAISGNSINGPSLVSIGQSMELIEINATQWNVVQIN